MLFCGAALAAVGLLMLIFIRSTPLRYVSAAYFGRLPAAVVFWIFTIAVYFILGVCIAAAAEWGKLSGKCGKCICNMCITFLLLLVWYPLLYAYCAPALALAALIAAGIFCFLAARYAVKCWITVGIGLYAVLAWIVYLTIMCASFMITM